jgi:hypothetical protein
MTAPVEVVRRVPALLAAALGLVIGGLVRALAVVRTAPKPMHGEGWVRDGRLVRFGLDDPFGVAFLDEPGEHEVVVRESRAIGLPPSWPDIRGLAVRVVNPDGSPGDLLLNSTGHGRVTRFLLTVSDTAYGRPMTTMFPFRTPAGPTLLGAHEVAEDRLELSAAVGLGPWRRFGELRLAPRRGDEDVWFDAVLNEVAGLSQFEWVRRLRSPSYRQSRLSRGLRVQP